MTYRVPPVGPRMSPPLDPGFRPMALAEAALRAEILAVGTGIRVALAVEQPGASVWHRDAWVYPPGHPGEAASHRAVERLCKFLLWSRGGARLYVDGPAPLVASLRRHYAADPAGMFDSDFMGPKLFGVPFEVVGVAEADFPPEREAAVALGRHLDGCRIGFDLGASDRKAAAVIVGEVVFSDETVWDPYHKADPQYHFDGVMDSLR